LEQKIKIALVGNPNSGKSTVFNALTGLRQKVANFPGVTVEKRTGFTSIKTIQGNKIEAEIIDLPGTYSLYPKSPEEILPFQLLCDPHNESHPDLTIVVADGTNLKRNLFLCSQILDLKIPVILVINMMDIVLQKKMSIDFAGISKRLGIPVIGMDGRSGKGVQELREAIGKPLVSPVNDFIDVREFAPGLIEELRSIVKVESNYNAFLAANNLSLISGFEMQQWKKDKITAACEKYNFDAQQMQARETLERYTVITQILKEHLTSHEVPLQKSNSYKIDSFLTHRIWGYLIFMVILFMIFQVIFSWASYPMDWIDNGFLILSEFARDSLPSGLLNDLFVDGILAGLNGIVVFVPQIALLFFFVAILEDTGYMARVSFIMDRLMKKFGMNGKSLIPLMSGVACAVPAIMSTRTIQNRKERLITIMVTPLMSCSARLPVYTLLIALVIPRGDIFGFNMQGVVMMILYLLGFVAALGAALAMKYIIKKKERSFFVMELPMYRVPRWSSIGIHVLEKVKIFLFDAGKIIVAISIILWVLSSFGPGGVFDSIEAKYHAQSEKGIIQEHDVARLIQTEKLEASYAGKLGHLIEPAIAPLGFDWKIGIALITSFAAREVFVGTMSTIYSVGGDESVKLTIKEKMAAEINPHTGGPRYTFAVGLSLMLFYAFAMQCMSTVAVVYRETKRIRYPLIQILYMSGLAYLASLIVYQLLKP